MATAGVFTEYLWSAQVPPGQADRETVRRLFFAAIVASAGLVFVAVVLLTYLGYVTPWSGRFYSLYDTG